MNDPIIIRNLSLKDLKLAKIYNQYINAMILDKEPILYNKPISLKAEKNYLKTILQSIRKHATIYLVAWKGNELVGIIRASSMGKMYNNIWDIGITVKKEYRGRGLGGRLIESILVMLKTLKPMPNMLRLSVFSDNIKAINLYKKYGFKKIATIPKQILTEKGLTDEVIMFREL